MTWPRRKRQPVPVPERTPHPDGRMEAELQRVLSLQRTAGRSEARLEAILTQRAELEARASRETIQGHGSIARRLLEQAAQLREERAELEAELPPLHEEISTRLAALGDDAAYLLPEPARRREADR